MPKGAGRPPFQPTDKQRRDVEIMSAAGIRREIIASVIGTTEPTLYKHFRAELDEGKERVTSKVVNSLVSEALAGNMTAAIFYLKTQARWREGPTGSEDDPVHIAIKRVNTARSDG